MKNPSAANWYGLWTLYAREVRRFTKVYTQTILGPMATALLFLAIFALALERGRARVRGINGLTGRCRKLPVSSASSTNAARPARAHPAPGS